jgi:hypothetical protein
VVAVCADAGGSFALGELPVDEVVDVVVHDVMISRLRVDVMISRLRVMCWACGDVDQCDPLWLVWFVVSATIV